MSNSVSIAEPRHQPWLAASDNSVDEAWVSRCIALGEYLVAEKSCAPVGFLRWSRFWGKVPYMDMICVDRPFRKTGIGALLLDHWLNLAVASGATTVMTSCESDEQTALNWHLRNGFERVGEIMFPTIQESSEIFLAKRL
ncbi:MAG: GNAT family N-acetyltransferase [Pseudomonadota bacterium]